MPGSAASAADRQRRRPAGRSRCSPTLHRNHPDPGRSCHQPATRSIVAIKGAGYFQVLLPSGQTGYTRAGGFHLDSQGNMVTADGNSLQPAIAIPRQRHQHLHRHRRHGQRHPARADPGLEGRRHPDRHVHQSRRPEQRWQQYLPADRRLRRSHRRLPRRRRRHWRPAAIHARAVQRQRRRPVRRR